MMTKKVNIYPKYPVTSVSPAIRTVTLAVTKTIEDIRKCIIARAIVDEVLSDGTTVRLTMSNFNKNNDKSKVTKAVEAVEAAEPVEEKPVDITEQEGIVVDEEPAEEEVVEEAPVEEKPTYQQNNNYNNKHNKKNKNNKFNNNNNQQNNKSEDNEDK